MCRKWREVFWAEPRLWRSIRLARPISAAMPEEAAGAAQQLQVLQRVARHVQVAEVRAMHYGPQPPEAAAWHAAALLLELPEMLGALALRHEAAHHTAPPCLPEVALEVLPRFAAGLTRLELASTRLAARPAAAALARLPHLRHLALNMGAVSGDVLQAAQQLPALTRLELDSPPAELPERLPQLLGALTQLRELACMGCGALPAGTITAVAEQLRQLQALALAMPLPPHELRQLARLPQLRRLELCERRIRADSAELPPPAACAALQSHHFWRESDSGCFVVGALRGRAPQSQHSWWRVSH